MACCLRWKLFRNALSSSSGHPSSSRLTIHDASATPSSSLTSVDDKWVSIWADDKALAHPTISRDYYIFEHECLVKVNETEAKELGLPQVDAHYRATCFNNCKGVNPNAITAAGVALVALSGIGSTAGLGPGAVGIGGAVLAGKLMKKVQQIS